MEEFMEEYTHGRIQSHQKVLVWFSIFSVFCFLSFVLSLKIMFLICVVLNALSYLQIATWVDFRKRVGSVN